MKRWNLPLVHGQIHQLALLGALTLTTSACDDGDDNQDTEAMDRSLPYDSIETIDMTAPPECHDEAPLGELGESEEMTPEKQAFMAAEIAAQLAAADCETHDLDHEFLPESGKFGPVLAEDYVDEYACEYGPEHTELELAPNGSTEESDGFGYPVGDKTTYPAGGWKIWQVVGYYASSYGGRHLAHDVVRKDGGKATINAPVYAMADGVVRDAQMRSSAYKGVVTIEHDDGKGGKVCSFYAHMNTPLVKKGDTIERGEQIGTVRDWAKCKDGGKSSNSHLHYSLVSQEVCEQALDTKKRTVCSHDTGKKNNIDSLDEEPEAYTPIKDDCDHYKHGAGILSPTKFVEENHF